MKEPKPITQIRRQEGLWAGFWPTLRFALVLLVLYETASDFNHTEWLALILIGCGDSALTVVQQWLGKRN